MNYYKLILFLPLLFCCCSCAIEDIAAPRRTGVAGGREVPDEFEPKYYVLAKESLKLYNEEHPNWPPQIFVKIENVTVRMVAGVLIKITFLATTADSSNSANTICFSEVFEQAYLNKTQMKVYCHELHRVKRQIGPETKNASDPQYRKLAETSLEIFLEDNPDLQPYKVASVFSVTTMVIEGLLTTIVFTARPLYYPHNKLGAELICDTKIWDRALLKKREITVNCNG